MEKTITRGDVSITLFLNPDNSVDLRKKMKVVIDGVESECYPDGVKGLGTINDQFGLIEAVRKFDETYFRIKMGGKIKELREAAGLTQEQLADKTGLQRSNIARIESGKYSTGQDILSRIATALGKKLDIV